MITIAHPEHSSGELIKQELSFLHATLLLDLIYVSIILSQTVWELQPAQDFGFRGDNYITKKVRVVSLALDILSCPYLCLYQISNILNL